MKLGLDQKLHTIDGMAYLVTRRRRRARGYAVMAIYDVATTEGFPVAELVVVRGRCVAYPDAALDPKERRSEHRTLANALAYVATLAHG